MKQVAVPVLQQHLPQSGLDHLLRLNEYHLDHHYLKESKPHLQLIDQFGLVPPHPGIYRLRSEEHTSELQSRFDLVCRLLLEKKKQKQHPWTAIAASPL